MLVIGVFEASMRFKMANVKLRSAGEEDNDVIRYVRMTCDRGRAARGESALKRAGLWLEPPELGSRGGEVQLIGATGAAAAAAEC